MSVAGAIGGDPQTLYDLADAVKGLSSNLTNATAELRDISAGQWEGAASEAFHRVVHFQPDRFSSAADAFWTASMAISEFAMELEYAIARVEAAVRLYEEAQAETAAWQRSTVRAVALPIGPDPGEAGARQAQSLMESAKSALDQASRIVIQSLSVAASEAPTGPGFLGEFADGVTTVNREIFHYGEQVLSGVVAGVVGMADGVYMLAKVAWEFSPERFLLDPRGWIASVKSTGETIDHIAEFAVHHPAAFAETFGKSLTNWNEWATDPAKAVGELIPGIILAFATAGIGAGADALGASADALDESATALDDSSTALSETADSLDSLAGMSDDGGEDLGSIATNLRDVSANNADLSNSLSQMAEAFATKQDQLKAVVGAVNAAGNTETAEGIVLAADQQPGHTADGSVSGELAGKVGEQFPMIP
jgi:hypothetical protein